MLRIRHGNQQHVYWERIRVGDIVKVQSDDSFPADLLCLSSSDTNGVAYVETSQLDGETSLKTRSACPQTMTMNTLEHFASFRGNGNCILTIASANNV